MLLEVISPEGILIKQETDLVKLPGKVGEFTVLYGHAPLISILTKGIIYYQIGTETKSLPVEGGFAEVADDIITVCID